MFLASGYESNWKVPVVWKIVRTMGGSDLQAGRTLTFEGLGDGGAESLVKLDGSEWGRGCRFDLTTDSVTFEVGGQKYRVARQSGLTPVTLSGVLAALGSNSGGSWTAEEGSSGAGNWPGDDGPSLQAPSGGAPLPRAKEDDHAGV